ncbi:Beta-hydroxyacyl-(acyl-carrier-protein) dehydratase FabA/FabZ [Desulfatibacillum aliphaticivorans]|uniref:Beta-hydroxyacyl-(Acyl-carrier-protein) dehydratase FabA/FabZ n=1 Tax=Desulfatibacillum aliphaticivorans TaxID=218208 RepID=B8FK83_DESAL|nr:type I polyketide synthase [Desulfatibacillum aliphaticivorans]ACL02758.1 Beta-hydroxyacyl-(acyl-carrier-protein) dehydratase FabA/FabZ [Desulfatibacillum aliphaticivorans]
MKKIAITGMSCLFPGASTPGEYWDNLIALKDCRTLASEERMGADPMDYFSPEKAKSDRFYCARGGYITDFSPDLHALDIPGVDLKTLDSLHQWSLYVAMEALKDAGCFPGIVPGRTGLILGNLSFPTQASNALFIPMMEQAVESALKKAGAGGNFSFPPWPGKKDPAWENGAISGWPAYLTAKALGLNGPRLALDAACSSSLYSVRLACDYLNSGRADMMLAGAVSAADPFFVNMGFSIFQAYPHNKESLPLDKKSGGLVAGEGSGMFVLKRLDDALRDEDRIHGVICGAGLSNDGRGASVLSPNPKGQAMAFERAYEDAGVSPSQVGFVECHATGTPLGDGIELDSMEAFFSQHKAKPYIGSVKAGLGHLLTAAGMAGMIKVILSLQNGSIPGTVGLENPADSKNKYFAGKVPASSTLWPEQENKKLGAVSAFGFGGANAHMIFEPAPENGDSAKDAFAAPASFPELAVVGMDAHFGSCSSLDEFLQANYEGEQQFIPLPPKRWKGLEKNPALLKQYGFEDGKAPKGAYIRDFDLDFLRFKIPPNPDDQLIPQQMLAMKVADKAIQRAGLKQGQNTAVLVAMGTEPELHRYRGRVNQDTRLPQALGKEAAPEVGKLTSLCKNAVCNAAKVNQYTSFIGNIMAARIASLWDFNGPAFTISSEENSVFKAVEIAAMLLEKGEVEAVVVGAVDLSGSPENVLWRNAKQLVQKGRATLSFDKGNTGWLIGEGAGAIVLKKADDARKNSDPIHCVIRSLALEQGMDSQAVEAAAKRAVREAGISFADIGFLEACASGMPEYDEAETTGLLAAYGGGESPSCALGAAKALFGHSFAASQMASIIRAALCAEHGFLPRTPGWSMPKNPEPWEDGRFFIPERSQPWFARPEKQERIAAVSGLGMDGCAGHMILVCEGQKESSALWNIGGPFIIPLAGDDRRALESRLDELMQDLEAGKTPAECSRKYFNRLKPGKYSLALIGADLRELQNEIDAARQGMAKALQTGRDWFSVRGSAFSPNPMGEKGKVAFVYPGGFSSYPQMGRDFFQLFPVCAKTCMAPGNDLGDLWRDGLLYPRGMTFTPPGKQVWALEKSAIAMFESGILFAIARTDAVRKCLGITPHMAFGYSMGEISMLYSLGVWGRTDAMSRQLRKSAVFQTRLAGPMDTVRKAWGMPPQEEDREKIWHCFALKTDPKSLREVMASEKTGGRKQRVFHTFTNTPGEVVIAGEEAACMRVIQNAGCEYFEVPMGDAIHCDIVRADYNEMVSLHSLETAPVRDVEFLTTVGCGPLELDQDAIARNIAEMYCSRVDFASLVNKAYDQGARVFIELGPRENCTQYISETLGEREYLAVATDRKGAGCRTSMLRALARLFSHQIPMDLGCVIPRPEKSPDGPQLIKTVTLGGESIEEAIIPEARKIFNQAKEPAPEPTPEQPKPVVAEKIPYKEPVREIRPEAAPAPEPLAAQTAAAPSHPLLMQAYRENQTLVTEGHKSFLRNRARALRQMEQHIAMQAGLMEKEVNPEPLAGPLPEFSPVPPIDIPPAPASAVPKSAAKSAIWDRQDLETFAKGDIAQVFGPEYAIIDSYKRRVRLPMDPYLLVSRVTKLQGERGDFKPSAMTTEFDIEKDAWFLIDGQIPWAVSVESGQCDLLLISYLGIDFECKGERVYRLLDCTLTFMEDLAKEGETLRYDISINSFARNGGNLLFFFSYECFVDDRLVLTMDGGCAGFFSDEELAAGKGIIRTQAEQEERNNIIPVKFNPLLDCGRRSFSKEDLLHIIEGRPAACFGPDYDQQGANPSLKFAAQQMLMVDRVESVDPQGGPWGLGKVIAHKDLRPAHWYFPCHFKDDEVMAGSLMAEGCVQLLQFFTLFLGLQTKTRDARFQPIIGLPQKVRCRGQVAPEDSLLTYRMEVKEIGLAPEPYAVADVDILLGDKVVVDFKDLGVRLSEKDPSAGIEVEQETPAAKPLFDNIDLQEFAVGDIAKCFGPAFDIYKDRQPPRTPNGDLQLISRVLEVEGTPGDFRNPASVVSEYDVPRNAWFCVQNNWPAIMPYSMLMEIALQPCGFISTYMQTTLLIPEKDLFFRNLDGEGTLSRLPDLRGRTITNRSRLTTTAKAGGSIIQKFEFDLLAEGEAFYQGTAAFGYFTKEALADQIGLDGGANNHPLHAREWLKDDAPTIEVDLQNGVPAEFAVSPSKPHYGLSGKQLQFLDRVLMVENSGRFGKGYIYADKVVNPADWFYPCHFHNDPVMPGSLGVEAMLQALQVFAVQQGLGREFASPYFTQMTDSIVWKYRGQIIPSNERMTLELHVKSVEQGPGAIVIKADGNLWKDNIRIYEVSDVGFCIRDAG